MKTTRVFQLTALVLVVLSVVQVGWWVYDQRGDALRKAQMQRDFYAQELAAAQALLDAGTPEQRVREMLPRVVIAEGRATASPDFERQIERQQYKEINQYVWESAFFLLALGACMAVIARALRAEARVLQEQDHFLALVSHQFKTPLASLQLSLETLSMRSLSPPEQRSLIDRMLADLARMEALVTRILDSVRLERGRVDLKREAVELSSAVARVVGQFEERARKEGITFSTDVPRGLEVFADPLAVDVVIRNLVENALAAVAPLGGGTITLAARRLNGEIELAVRDTGVGFRPDDTAQLFRKFSRLKRDGGSAYYGTGLGLFIVRRMMQLAGGRVSAHSDGEGRGAQFVLAWPMAPVETR
ncbi:MAG: HAMP domain-containing histidine kinase [Steroidobacteraceae bacterium]|nr:HAMP domain-containing histidine kinase [Steroidobacteraceae bacterium]